MSTTATRKPRQKVDPQTKLRALAPKRVTKALRAIRAVGKLGRYRPTNAQTSAVFGALKSAVDNAHQQWVTGATAEERPFVLPD